MKKQLFTYILCLLTLISFSQDSLTIKCGAVQEFHDFAGTQFEIYELKPFAVDSFSFISSSPILFDEESVEYKWDHQVNQTIEITFFSNYPPKNIHLILDDSTKSKHVLAKMRFNSASEVIDEINILGDHSCKSKVFSLDLTPYTQHNMALTELKSYTLSFSAKALKNGVTGIQLLKKDKHLKSVPVQEYEEYLNQTK